MFNIGFDSASNSSMLFLLDFLSELSSFTSLLRILLFIMGFLVVYLLKLNTPFPNSVSSSSGFNFIYSSKFV